jgi:sodium transport system permease protein
MRWSIIRLIWVRELRDQLRDRRTLLMIAVLPLVIYPLAGFGMVQMLFGSLKKQNPVGIVGGEHLPAWEPRFAPPVAAASWFACTPAPPACPLGAVAQAVAAVSLDESHQFDFPPLYCRENGQAHFLAPYVETAEDAETLPIRLYDDPLPPGLEGEAFFERIDRTPLDSRQVDLLLVVPPDFGEQLRRGGRPAVYILTREGDERSRQTGARVAGVLARWKKKLKEARLLRQGLAANYDDAFEVRDPERAKPPAKRAAEELFDTVLRIFPFILVMWCLAGALYPAVDVCAGEKERGTMETLLISPASREEIVWGKFLTIWVFSAATALLNLLSMGLTTWQFSRAMPGDVFRFAALVWAVVLLLPLSAFFSAVALAVGAYARSSKEGQYYLMPLFLLTMPLVFLTLAPGVELNPFYSMVPVTGVALLLQKMMATTAPDRALWLYFLTVLSPLLIYSWLALRWAIEQFQREEVLFREAERLELGLWVRALFSQKEVLPGKAQALFCFGLLLTLQWASLNPGVSLTLGRATLNNVGFVALPPVVMALLLTCRPRQGLALRRPTWWGWPAAALLGVLLLPPLAELTLLILRELPAVAEVLESARSQLKAALGPDTPPGTFLLTWAVLPALCQELAFRGFILTGFRHRFSARTAIFLSSFLFALYPMNVALFVPQFLFGAAAAYLVLRCGSVLPAMFLHLVYRAVPLLFPTFFADLISLANFSDEPAFGTHWIFSGLCALLAGAVLVGIAFLRKTEVWEEAGEPDPDASRGEPLVLAGQTAPLRSENI